MEFRLVLILLLLVGGSSAQAIDIEAPAVQDFIDSMVSDHSYDRGMLESVLQQAEAQESILEAIARPAERTKEST